MLSAFRNQLLDNVVKLDMSEKQPTKQPKHGRGVIHPKMKEATWKKGQSGNPGGRPKGRSLVTLIKEIGREALPKNLAKESGCKDWNELLARTALQKALEEHPYFKSILDLEREGAELLTEFLELVNRYGISKEQIEADPVLREAAIRCGYISDGANEGAGNSGAS